MRFVTCNNNNNVRIYIYYIVEILHNIKSDHVGLTLRLHIYLFDDLVSDNNQVSIFQLTAW